MKKDKEGGELANGQRAMRNKIIKLKNIKGD